MDRLEEVLRLEKIRDPIERVVVDQNGAENALFRFDIVRRSAISRCSRVGRELENVRISQGHLKFVLRILSDAGRDKAPPRSRVKAGSRLMPDSHNTENET